MACLLWYCVTEQAFEYIKQKVHTYLPSNMGLNRIIYLSPGKMNTWNFCFMNVANQYT